ncbi:hypothetical protein K2Z84_24325 [Candidatus Binatia bacterium]|nr:hypothetical protein [Candidatus Binatia bacterium]
MPFSRSPRAQRVSFSSLWIGRAGAVPLLAVLALAACSGSGSSGQGDGSATPACADGVKEYASTFAGIQDRIFEQHGCTSTICHGSAAAGGLQLTADVAYANLFEVTAQGSGLKRVAPGDNDRSYLWLKLAAATRPGTVAIKGAPMPNGLPALSEDDLELVRLWIYAGAPATGTVLGTEQLLGACLPPPEPITIEPLPSPAPGAGIQFDMPAYELPNHREIEYCFATYEDFSDQVPAEYRDPSGKYFRFDATELRQDPQSHHLILWYARANDDPSFDLHDPAYGEWTCVGGEQEGAACEPTEQGACGSGHCTAAIRSTFACIGYGPQTSFTGRGLNVTVGGAQQAQDRTAYTPGVFAQIPIKGVFYWNSHAFNLTAKDARMHARINYEFAHDQRYPIRAGGILTPGSIFRMSGIPAYATGDVCDDFTFEQGSRVFELSSHVHKRGKHFWITAPDGSRLYENFTYNDPSVARFDPPLAFDSPDPKERTVRFCATFNNGVAADGSPDPETVTRASRIPASAHASGIGLCTPSACASGRIGERCAGEDDDSSCDTSPGAGDGSCDACPLTGGESTENEMFLMLGSYYVDPAAAAGTASVATVDASGRSLDSELLAPPVAACRGPMPGGLVLSGDASVAHAGHTSD